MKKYFHLSNTFLGEEAILEPRVPNSSLISVEGNIPRVCFSTNVFYCFRSICGTNSISFNDFANFKDKKINQEHYSEEFFEAWDAMIEKGDFKIINPAIYITNEQLYLPPKCSDYRSNKEHWSLKPVKVKFQGYLCLKSLTERKLKITNDINTLDTQEYLKNITEIHRIYKPTSMKLS
jgi:hypothetical protein